MATVECGDSYNHGNGIELDENASDESDFFLVRTGPGGTTTVNKIRPVAHAVAPPVAPASELPAGRNGSPSFSNTVSVLSGVSSITRKRKIEKEEKDSAEHEGRKTRAEPGVPMVFGKQYLRAADHLHGDGDKMPHWHPPGDVDQGLAADFDDSLSGLGVNISSTTYNMSEALLALPNISNMSTLLKNEATSLPPSDAGSMNHSIDTAASTSSVSYDANTNDEVSPAPGRATAAVVVADAHKRQQHRFQYVLNAATSIATKVNEETLTYLNQGQSYEIRIKKLGDLTSCSDAIFQTKLKLCFHERRLQYIEKEQLDAWRNARPGDRLLEVDLPLSYGIFDVRQDPNQLNCCELLWSPNKEVGVYVKIHSVSTEFTPKKHGGEKGVPFRIQAETYVGGDPAGPLLHCAASQVKVFKLKGADRKHKQDRERIMKRPVSELDRYQPSYDCTILTEMPIELVYSAQQAPSTVAPPVELATRRLPAVSPPPAAGDADYKPQQGSQPSSSPTDSINEDEAGMQAQVQGAAPPDAADADPLSVRATSDQTHGWLMRNRFSGHAAALCNFTGADLMRMSRDDVVQLCGLADGVRLYNCLHHKLILPRLTVYVSEPTSLLYHAFYLYQTTRAEVTRKLAALLGHATERVRQVCVEGPCGVPVLLTDEVVRHLQNESLYKMETIPVTHNGDRVDLILHRTVFRGTSAYGGSPSARGQSN